MKKKCPYCKETITYEKQQQFAGHCCTCPKRKGSKEIYNKSKKTKLNKRQDYKIVCKKCKKDFVLNLTIHQHNIGKYNKYCSGLCAHSHIQTVEQNKKRSIKLKGKIRVERIKRICPICNTEYECILSSKQKTCKNKKCVNNCISKTQKISEWSRVL